MRAATAPVESRSLQSLRERSLRTLLLLHPPACRRAKRLKKLTRLFISSAAQGATTRFKHRTWLLLLAILSAHVAAFAVLVTQVGRFKGRGSLPRHGGLPQRGLRASQRSLAASLGITPLSQPLLAPGRSITCPTSRWAAPRLRRATPTRTAPPSWRAQRTASS